jgi:hypothetical protein
VRRKIFREKNQKMYRNKITSAPLDLGKQRRNKIKMRHGLRKRSIALRLISASPHARTPILV